MSNIKRAIFYTQIENMFPILLVQSFQYLLHLFSLNFLKSPAIHIEYNLETALFRSSMKNIFIFGCTTTS